MKGVSDKQNANKDGGKKPKKKRKLPPHLWKKGQSGNPAGRPKMGHAIADLLRWAENLKAPEGLESRMREIYELPEEEPLTVKQVVILASMLQAMKGDRAHIQFWAERTEGRMPETLNVEQQNKMVVVEEIVGQEEGAVAEEVTEETEEA